MYPRRRHRRLASVATGGNRHPGGAGLTLSRGTRAKPGMSQAPSGDGLRDVLELMGEQRSSGWRGCTGCLAQHHVLADRVGMGPEGARRRIRLLVRVDAHTRKVVPESILHVAACAVFERLTTTAADDGANMTGQRI